MNKMINEIIYNMLKQWSFSDLIAIKIKNGEALIYSYYYDVLQIDVLYRVNLFKTCKSVCGCMRTNSKSAYCKYL
jgi:hypothetical protein